MDDFLELRKRYISLVSFLFLENLLCNIDENIDENIDWEYRLGIQTRI